MSVKFANFGTAKLAAPISATDTELTITAGDEANFPTLLAGDWTPIVVVDALANREVMRCTARAANLLTVVRGQENTPSFSFAAGARVDARLTAAALAAFAQTSGSTSWGGNITITPADGRLLFSGAGLTGIHFNQAKLFFGASEPLKQFLWWDSVLGDVASMNREGRLALGRQTIPGNAGTDLFVATASLNTLGLNSYVNTAGTPKWVHRAAGWAGYINLDAAGGVLGIVRSDATRAAGADMSPATNLVYWDTAKNARFPSAVFAGEAYLNTNGNVTGSIWPNYGTGHYDAYSAIYNRIENRCVDFRNTVVNDTRMAGYIGVDLNTSGAGPYYEYSGYVITAARKSGGDNFAFYWRQPQRLIPNQGWVAAFGF